MMKGGQGKILALLSKSMFIGNDLGTAEKISI